MAMKKKIGRPSKDSAELKKKVYARLYPKQIQKIARSGFSGLQDFLDVKIQELDSEKTRM